MKLLLGILPILLALQVIGRAQEFKLKSEILDNTEKIVKGAPFSAEAVSESVQLMFDGNKIIRSVRSSLFRDGEGRFRREEMPKPVGTGLFVETPKTVSIFDPVSGLKFFLNSDSKTAQQVGFNNKEKRVEIEKKRVEIEKKRVEIEKRRTEVRIEKKRVEIEKQKDKENSNENSDRDSNGNSNGDDDQKQKRPEVTKPTDASQAEKIIKMPTKPKLPTESKLPVFPKGEVKTETLGMRKIEGVEAEGTRFTKTISAGEIGNERTFEIVYERWYSKDLQLIVFSKYTDPRFGEQTYQLTNIKRTEPDVELFKVPADYKIVNANKPFVFKTINPLEKKKSE